MGVDISAIIFIIKQVGAKKSTVWVSPQKSRFLTLYGTGFGRPAPGGAVSLRPADRFHTAGIEKRGKTAC
jgi:hypothetical protein